MVEMTWHGIPIKLRLPSSELASKLWIISNHVLISLKGEIVSIVDGVTLAWSEVTNGNGNVWSPIHYIT